MSANIQRWNVLAVQLVYRADTDVGAGKTSHAGEEEWPAEENHYGRITGVEK